MKNGSDQDSLHILEQLSKSPAVPFHEDLVQYSILEFLESMSGVDVTVDRFGNVIAHYQNLSSSESTCPPLVFVAHMDHPGFEIINAGSTPQSFIAKALGGVPEACFNKTVSCFVLLPNGRRLPATIEHSDDAKSLLENGRLVNVVVESDEQFVMPAALVFDLPDFVVDNEKIYMRAADDLAGCAAILSSLNRLVLAKAETNFYGVFTRAEEGGLFGARLLAESRILPDHAFVVSVETSSLIPGVEQGLGPVIRTGDRLCTFDSDAENILRYAAAEITESDSEFKYQRQLMSAGTCEASAFAAFGYKVTGIAFTLGNWHNATTFIGDPSGGVDSEFINLTDYFQGIKLIEHAAIGAFRGRVSESREALISIPNDIKDRMLKTAQSSD